MADSNEKEPKIFVDSDWKAEAQREKEKLDRESREAGPTDLPEPSLLEMVQMVMIQALVGLGAVQDPRTGQPMPPNLPIAKHYIDLLDLFVQKAGPNMDPQEKKQAEGMLNELQMAFVQLANAGAQMPDQEPGGPSA